MGLVIFAGVIVVDGLLHFYLWKRLVRDTMRGRWPRRIGAVVAVLLAVLLPATVGASRSGRIGELAWFGFLWLALMFYLFLLVIVLEVPRVVVALVRRRQRRTTTAVDLAAQAPVTVPAETGQPAVTVPAETGKAAVTVPMEDAGASSRTGNATHPAEPARIAASQTSATDETGAANQADTASQAGTITPAGAPGGDASSHGRTAASGGGDSSGRAPERPGVDRRLVLARGAAIFAGLTAVGITGYGVKTALGPPQLDRVQLPLAKLPRAMDGTRLAVVSDIHLGPLSGSHHVGRIVDLINSVNADIVCVVGDLVDGSVAELGRFAEPLAGIRSRQGAYFVTGNHEYYSGFQPWVDEVARLGVRPLRNERVALGGLDLAGVNDLGGAAYGDPADFGKALGDRDASRPVVLMAHQPVAVHRAAKYGVDLQVSGHTHGGQVAPFNLVVRLQQPVVSGLGRVDGVPVYVTNGAGFWGPPVRVGAPPQVTVIDLRTP